MSIGRASALIAAGTIVSRLTGLLRSIVLVAAIGSVGSGAADAFAIANQLPNNI
jgi:putative peptidoglycan lipid II flippase